MNFKIHLFRSRERFVYTFSNSCWSPEFLFLHYWAHSDIVIQIICSFCLILPYLTPIRGRQLSVFGSSVIWIVGVSMYNFSADVCDVD